MYWKIHSIPNLFSSEPMDQNHITSSTLKVESKKCSTMIQRLVRPFLTLAKIFFPSTIFLKFFLSSIIPPLTNIIPMFFTGNIPNSSALAVASQFMFVSIILKVIQEGVGNSLFHFVGTHYKENLPLALTGFKMSLLVLLVGGILLTSMMLLWNEQFVKLIETPETISEATRQFFCISAFSFIPTLFTTAFTNYLLISTSTWLVVAQIVNVALSFLVNFFTLGQQSVSLHWGVEELGIYTVFHSTLTMIVNFGFVLVVEDMGPLTFFLKPPFFNDLKSNWKRFFSVSWGNFADSIVRNFFYLFVTLKFINHLGEDEAAAWNLLNGIIWGIVLLPAFAVANYVKVRIGHNSSRATIKEVAKESVACLIAWSLLMVVFTATLWSILASFFSKSNQKVAFLSETMLHDIGWVFIIFAYNNAVHSFFLATGKTEYVFYQSFATNLIVYFMPFMLYLFHILTPTYWWVLGLYIVGMLTNCCLTSYFCVIVWKSIANDLCEHNLND